MRIEDLGNSLTSSIIIHDMLNSMPFDDALKRNEPIHEWIFINLLMTQLLENQDMAVKFCAFAYQYFPKYVWKYVCFSKMREMVALECGYYDLIFKNYYVYGYDIPEEKLNSAFEFGEIVTDFCIKYLNYSLIGCGGAKIIITSQDRCDKKFDEYLREGYDLLRKSKVYYIPHFYRIFGSFRSLPVLPKNNLYYGNEEFIQNEYYGYSRVMK